MVAVSAVPTWSTEGPLAVRALLVRAVRHVVVDDLRAAVQARLRPVHTQARRRVRVRRQRRLVRPGGLLEHVLHLHRDRLQRPVCNETFGICLMLLVLAASRLHLQLVGVVGVLVLRVLVVRRQLEAQIPARIVDLEQLLVRPASDLIPYIVVTRVGVHRHHLARRRYVLVHGERLRRLGREHRRRVHPQPQLDLLLHRPVLTMAGISQIPSFGRMGTKKCVRMAPPRYSLSEVESKRGSADVQKQSLGGARGKATVQGEEKLSSKAGLDRDEDRSCKAFRET